MRWLAIEVHFLSGRYHGRGDDGRSAEWPPNPHRLFQALVAAANLGYRRTEAIEAKRAALLWLEARPPPEIVASLATVLSTLRLYVPNNDADRSDWVQASGAPMSALRTAKDLRPQRLDGDHTVRFLWPIADAEWEVVRPHVELICEEARHLHALGLGIDLVAGNGRVLDDGERLGLSGETWVADVDGLGWRAPVPGSLDELTERHTGMETRVRAFAGRGQQRSAAPPAPPVVWREVGYRRRAEGRARRVHAFSLVGAEGESLSFDPRRTIEVAAWLRHAAHVAAERMKLDRAFIDGFVCGHGDDAETKSDRFSYLPLPTITPRGRDGRIRRVLVAEPFGGGGSKAAQLVRRLAGMPLAEEGSGEIMAELRPEPSAWDGVFGRYLPRAGAKVWASVTPIVLPGRDDERSRKAIGLVLKALVQAGYTTPVVEVTLQTVPAFPGQEKARSYRVPEYLKPYPRTHARISFVEPVRGPLAIGSGRHAGLGLFAAVEEKGRGRN